MTFAVGRAFDAVRKEWKGAEQEIYEGGAFWAVNRD
jgi:hypothetical protein